MSTADIRATLDPGAVRWAERVIAERAAPGLRLPDLGSGGKAGPPSRRYRAAYAVHAMAAAQPGRWWQDVARAALCVKAEEPGEGDAP